MIAADLASDIEILGGRLVALDALAAAKVFADLNEQADAALGDGMVRRRLGEAHGKQRRIDTMMRRIVRQHAVTVEAVRSDLKRNHLLMARRHVAHALRNRLHLSYKDTGRALCCDHSTALRYVREWDTYLESKS